MEEGSYNDIYFDEESISIAVLNEFHEWIIFCEQHEQLRKIITCLKNKNKPFRGIIISKEKFNTDIANHLCGCKYHIEDFMICNINQVKVYSKYYFAKTNDIDALVNLNMDYCEEEVSWRYYHRNAHDNKSDYRFKVSKNNVFIYGQPVKSKVEIVSRHSNYIKLGSIYTDKIHRGNGFAKLCLEGTLNWCLKNKLIPCLNVRKDNSIAKELYLKSGFENSGEVLYFMC
jgi:predicted GNAT family acetyltransferase